VVCPSFREHVLDFVSGSVFKPLIRGGRFGSPNFSSRRPGSARTPCPRLRQHRTAPRPAAATTLSCRVWSQFHYGVVAFSFSCKLNFCFARFRFWACRCYTYMLWERCEGRGGRGAFAARSTLPILLKIHSWRFTLGPGKITQSIIALPFSWMVALGPASDPISGPKNLPHEWPWGTGQSVKRSVAGLTWAAKTVSVPFCLLENVCSKLALFAWVPLLGGLMRQPMGLLLGQLTGNMGQLTPVLHCVL
jgi:hypothetical protein